MWSRVRSSASLRRQASSLTRVVVLDVYKRQLEAWNLLSEDAALFQGLDGFVLQICAWASEHGLLTSQIALLAAGQAVRPVSYTHLGDLFLWNTKIFLDLFQVTAMKMFFSFYFLFHACTHNLISFALVSAMVAKDKPWVL